MEPSKDLDSGAEKQSTSPPALLEDEPEKPRPIFQPTRSFPDFEGTWNLRIHLLLKEMEHEEPAGWHNRCLYLLSTLNPNQKRSLGTIVRRLDWTCVSTRS